MNLQAWGVQEGYHDVHGHWHHAQHDALQTVLAALRAHGSDSHADAPPPSPMQFARPGDAISYERAVTIELEDGATVDLAPGETAPSDLPLGYHLVASDTGTHVLTVTPGACHLPDSLRTWGWALQLYALRSRASWGMGDLVDLRRVNAWSREHGAGMTLINPLGAVLPIPSQQPSPYYPSSRRFRNPLYLRIEALPGASVIGADLDGLAQAGRALNDARRIDRDAVFRVKMDALELLWAHGRNRHDAGFTTWSKQQGSSLRAFATFCALAETHQSGWHDWPAEFRHPHSNAVAAFADEHSDRVRFHEWLQWLIDRQLAAATVDGLALMTDLPIGVDPGGADAWMWQDVMAMSMRVGAPPDEFNTQGQDWGLPPFDPWALRAAGYVPFVETVRAALQHAGGLRIDHVMGLWRLFWIPDGFSARDGLYVRYPARDLLDLLALESVRANAYIVGEDLGTVEDGVREELSQRRILTTKLVWFEEGPPVHYPRQSLAAVTTHDLATIAGLWTGADIDAQRHIGLDPNEGSIHGQRERLRHLINVENDAPVAAVVQATYAQLATSPSMVVNATLDDALCVTERPNQPGTVDEWPNWRIALPTPLDDVLEDDNVHAVARILSQR